MNYKILEFDQYAGAVKIENAMNDLAKRGYMFETQFHHKDKLIIVMSISAYTVLNDTWSVMEVDNDAARD